MIMDSDVVKDLEASCLWKVSDFHVPDESKSIKYEGESALGPLLVCYSQFDQGKDQKILEICIVQVHFQARNITEPNAGGVP